MQVLAYQGVDHVFWLRVRDQKPDPGYAATNQSGLLTLDGAPKLLAKAFRFPLSWHGSHVWLQAPTSAPGSPPPTSRTPIA